jgi:hypothetical protein
MRKALLLAILLVATAVAGCIADTRGPESATGDLGARLVAVGGALNQWVTHEPGRQANELSIAVNPTDPLNIIASGKDYTQPHAGGCVWDGIYVSKDGGATWTNGNLPYSPWKARADAAAGRQPEVHPDLSKFHCATDPVVAFGPDGTAYWTVMPYQCDPVSGSPTGRGTLPDGGFNDWLWTCSSMYVLASDDGGSTWPRIREVDFGPRLEHDKQWLTVAPDGTVLLCWDRDPSYQVASLLENPSGQNPGNQLSAKGFIACATSKDKGDTWSEPADANRDMSDPSGQAVTWVGYLPWVDYGRDNRAWMAALDLEKVLVTSSADGLVWDPPVAVGAYKDPPPGGEYGWPVLRGSEFRMFAVPSLAVDRSDGPYSGSVYVAWFDHSAPLPSGEGTYGRILFTYSRDGRNWTEPVRIRDDGPNPEHDQFMPAISVGPDGIVDLVWLDRRDDPGNHRYDAYHSFSADGGVTWSRNLRVSTNSSDEKHSHHQNGMVFLGDYIDIDAVCDSEGRCTAHPVWIDTRNGKADVYTATIERPVPSA